MISAAGQPTQTCTHTLSSSVLKVQSILLAGGRIKEEFKSPKAFP